MQLTLQWSHPNDSISNAFGAGDSLDGPAHQQNSGFYNWVAPAFVQRNSEFVGLVMTEILSEEERNNIEDQCEMIIGKAAFDSIEAAVLAKLAGVELPEPFGLFCGVRHDPPKTKEFWGMLNEGADNGSKCNLYTADQLRQAYAQGAAAQLSAEPACWESNLTGSFLSPESKASGECPKHFDVPLYTRKEAK